MRVSAGGQRVSDNTVTNMQLHGWIEIGPDGEKRVWKTEMKPPQRPENVKRLADGSLSVLPIIYETEAPQRWQRSGAVEDEFTDDAIIRRTPAVDMPLDDFKAICLREVREEAGERILAFAPMYRQVNATRDLLRDDDEAAEAAVEMFDRINAIRSACDAAEEDIMAATTAEEAASVTPFWPE